jgi:hypothetical protein
MERLCAGDVGPARAREFTGEFGTIPTHSATMSHSRAPDDLQRRAAMLDAATLWVGLAQRAENNNQVTQQQQQTQPKIERYRNA